MTSVFNQISCIVESIPRSVADSGIEGHSKNRYVEARFPIIQASRIRKVGERQRTREGRIDLCAIFLYPSWASERLLSSCQWILDKYSLVKRIVVWVSLRFKQHSSYHENTKFAVHHLERQLFEVNDLRQDKARMSWAYL